MERHETYVRPFYSTILWYLFFVFVANVMSAFCCLLMFPLAGNAGALQIQDTIFGSMPSVLIEFIAFMMISPLLGFLLFYGMRPKIYSKEIKKGWLPVYPGSDIIQWIPFKHETNGKILYPQWVESLPDKKVSLSLRPDHCYEGFLFVKDEDLKLNYIISANDYTENVASKSNNGVSTVWVEFIKFEGYNLFGVKTI